MGQPLSADVALADERATAALGASLVIALPDDYGGWLVALEGELGAGKTTLARGMLRALGHAGAVPSPTYMLVEPYELARGVVYHVDLYRIADQSELEFLGWSDLREGLVLVEWPERAPGLMAHADLAVVLFYADHGRRARIEGRSDRGRALVQRLSLTPSTTVSP